MEICLLFEHLFHLQKSKGVLQDGGEHANYYLLKKKAKTSVKMFGDGAIIHFHPSPSVINSGEWK